MECIRRPPELEYIDSSDIAKKARHISGSTNFLDDIVHSGIGLL